MIKRQTDRLFLSDLDGTLLMPDATLSDHAYTQLSILLQRGLPFTVATARTMYSVLPILRGLPLQYPMILQNGAVLYDPVEQRICHAAVIRPDACCAVFAAMEQANANGFVYCMEDGLLRCCYTQLTNPAMERFYKERRDRYEKPFRQVETLSVLSSAEVVYLSMTDTEIRLRPLAEALKTVSGIAVTFYRDVYETDRWYLELSADTATKYHGAMLLRQQLGCRHITGFGDNDNDLPLMQACDLRIAVANATPALRAAAHRMIGSNTEDAVIQYLQQQFPCKST